MGVFDELQAADEVIKAAKASGLDTAELEKARQAINERYQEEARAIWWKAHLEKLLQ